MKRDPIEQTQEFINAMKKIQSQLDRFNDDLDSRGIGMGRCHLYWGHKKQLLKKLGIEWKTPAEMNPYTIFD